MKSSFERFRLYHIDQSLRIRFQDLAGNDLGLRAGNYTVEQRAFGSCEYIPVAEISVAL